MSEATTTLEISKIVGESDRSYFVVLPSGQRIPISKKFVIDGLPGALVVPLWVPGWLRKKGLVKETSASGNLLSGQNSNLAVEQCGRPRGHCNHKPKTSDA